MAELPPPAPPPSPADAAELRKRLAALEALTTQQAEKVRRMQRSISWRLTAPLRAVRRAAWALAGRGASDRPRLRFCLDHPRQWGHPQERIDLLGWAFIERGSPVKAVVAWIGPVPHTLQHGLERVEPALAHPHSPEAQFSGFLGHALPIPPGRHSLRLELHLADGSCVPVLKRRVRGPVRKAAAVTHPLRYCLDHPSDWNRVDTHTDILGWVFEINGTPVQSLVARIGSKEYPLRHGLERLEPATAYPEQPAARLSGFSTRAIPVPPGWNRFQIDLTLADGRKFTLIKRKLQGAPEPVQPEIAPPPPPPPAPEPEPEPEPETPILCIDHPRTWDGLPPRIDFKGWIFLPSGEVLQGVRLRRGDEVREITYGINREEIGRTYPHLPQAARSGFYATEIPLSVKPQLLVAEALYPDGKWRPFFKQEARMAVSDEGRPGLRNQSWLRRWLSSWEGRGWHFDSEDEQSTWIKQQAALSLPCPLSGRILEVHGKVIDLSGVHATAGHPPGLRVAATGLSWSGEYFPDGPGHFCARFRLPPAGFPAGTQLEFRPIGTVWPDTLAWLGRVTATWPWPKDWHERLQEHRLKHTQRQLRIECLSADGEEVVDFRFKRPAPSAAQVRKAWQPGINLVGFFRAEFGIGESVRCAARACDATGLPSALIDLRLPSANRFGDTRYVSRLQVSNPHPVNIFHLDAPQSEEIDHHHGPEFRRDKYNIAYWAWELPEFPESWVRHARFFDEIWCPSEFCRAAIAAKSPIPVLSMPHAIDFEPPVPGPWREKFGLPGDRYLFLCLYDLNSQQERKNPRAAIEAYRLAFAEKAGTDMGLVLKVHNADNQPAAFAELKEAVAGLPGVQILSRTLPRAEVYALIQACDCFVSLHRAEGFGLAVAEAMYLGRPVISTDWSATAEFVREDNGCPVRATLKEIEKDHGPYRRGQKWADPDLEHASRFMRRLKEDPAWGEGLGRSGAAHMRESFSPAAIGARYRRRLDAFLSW